MQIGIRLQECMLECMLMIYLIACQFLISDSGTIPWLFTDLTQVFHFVLNGEELERFCWDGSRSLMRRLQLRKKDKEARSGNLTKFRIREVEWVTLVGYEVQVAYERLKSDIAN